MKTIDEILNDMPENIKNHAYAMGYSPQHLASLIFACQKGLSLNLNYEKEFYPKRHRYNQKMKKRKPPRKRKHGGRFLKL